MAATHGTPTGDLNAHGISPSGEVYWNQEAPALIEMAVARKEGVFSSHRALVTETGERTDVRQTTNSSSMKKPLLKTSIGEM